MISATVVRAEIGVPLGSDAGRRRPVGRIGGILGRGDALAGARLLVALGPGGQRLDTSRPGGIVADWDSCWLDGCQIARIEDWERVISRDRLAGVEGAFALAWIERDGSLMLARDAVGERTLFYSQTPIGFVFASTIQVVLASGLVTRRINPVAVATYLSYAYLPGPETLVEGVFEVPPGGVVRVEGGRVRRGAYWSLPPTAGSGGRDEGQDGQDWQDERRTVTARVGTGDLPDVDGASRALRARLERAVARRLPDREPVGAFLSGGLDSSLVVALARRLHAAPIRTYSVSFGDGYANELPFSSLVAAHCQTEHRIVELAPAVVLHHLDETIGLLSEPIGDPLTVPNALLFRQAAAEVAVVLNGEGGDPCFGGPKNLPMVLAELLGDGASTEPEQSLRRERSYLRAHGKCYDDLPRMLVPDVAAALQDEPLERALTPYLTDPRWPSFVAKLMALNVAFKGAHHILPKVDALSAAFGVVPRAPLFDRAVVELAVSLPSQVRLRGSVEKYVLKEAVRDLLPSAIVERPKSGMLVPVEAWFRGPLLPAARARLLDGLMPFGLFQRVYLERLLEGRLGSVRPRIGAKIWLLVTLEAWLRTVFGAPLPRV
jgi:asparagine synthase (glutamine-hydrolysing)